MPEVNLLYISEDMLKKIAMGIVNYVNEVNEVAVGVRQKNNDKCDKYVIGILRHYLCDYIKDTEESEAVDGSQG